MDLPFGGRFSVVGQMTFCLPAASLATFVSYGALHFPARCLRPTSRTLSSFVKDAPIPTQNAENQSGSPRSMRPRNSKRMIDGVARCPKPCRSSKRARKRAWAGTNKHVDAHIELAVPFVRQTRTSLLRLVNLPVCSSPSSAAVVSSSVKRGGFAASRGDRF